VSTAVVTLRLAAVEERCHRPAGVEVGQEHLPPVWGRAPCGGPVCRSSHRIDLPGLTRARSYRNTCLGPQPTLSPSHQGAPMRDVALACVAVALKAVVPTGCLEAFSGQEPSLIRVVSHLCAIDHVLPLSGTSVRSHYREAYA
jgi:hypothetical protein